MKKILVLGVWFSLISAASATNPAFQADAQNVNTGCTADATTAGCGNEKVGTGLLKCLHAYKMAHHDFKFSDACKTAMRQLHTDRKAASK